MAELNQNLQKEGKRYNKEFRTFRGVFTQASRNAIPEGKFYHLENIQPIGDANLHTIQDISSVLVDYTVNSIYWGFYANLLGTDYIILFSSNGKVFAYNIGLNSSTQINVSFPFSGSGSRGTQWKNTEILFIDSTGYYNWDGTTFSQITGTGVPTAGTEIAVYSGRVWIFNSRLLVVSAADDFSAAAFLGTNGAIAINLTDPTLRKSVTRAFVANGYLYFTGSSSINVISNVYVPSGANPPSPALTNTNIQSTVGSNMAGSFFTVDDRDVFFANSYGIYRIRGVTAERVSAEIDGTWQFRDPTVMSSGGAVVTNNILHAAVLMKRLNDPVFGSNTIIAMMANDRWWFANYGAVTFLIGAIVADQPSLFALIGNKLFNLFSSSATSPAFVVKTALWPMEDALADKQVIYAGFETTITTVSQAITATIDTVYGSIPFVANQNVGQVQWINNNSQIVAWQNNLLQTVTWFNGQFVLYWGNSPSAMAKYVGMTITGQGQLELSGIFMDYKFGNRWGGGIQ